MTGEEKLKIGDQLVCIENEGLMSVGSTNTITGLKCEFICFTKNGQIWEKRSEFRWSHYKHVPFKEVTQ